MKITLLFLLCFISATWQQNIYWSFAPRRVPFYSVFDKSLQDNLSAPTASDPSELGLYTEGYGYQQHEQDGIEQPTLQRSLESNFQQRLGTNLDWRSFGINNYLASLILNSLTLSSTTTSFTTSTSVITAAAVVTCFTSSMFSDTSACRRKRDAVPSLLIGDSDNEHLNAPLGGEKMASGMLDLPRKGRDTDPYQLIISSQSERNTHSQEYVPNKPTDSSVVRYLRKNRNIIISFTVTSTITSYSLYYSSSTRTVTNLADTSAMSCLPSGFSLC